MDIAMHEVDDLATPDDDLAMPDLATAPKAWMRQFGTAAEDDGDDVATDAAGNEYVVGTTWGGLDGNQNAGRLDVFLVKYDTNGKKLWTRQFGTPLDEFASGVATDGMGNVLVTGKTIGGLDGNPKADPGYFDAFVVKYDGNGKKLWIRQLGTLAHDRGVGVAADAAGNVYMMGTTEGGLDGNQNAGYTDSFLAKYDANGKKLWTRQFGTAANDDASGVATDSAANVFVTGWTAGGLDGNQNAGSSDIFLIKYDTKGNKLWTRQFGTVNGDGGNGVATDGMGNVFVTGATTGGLDGNQNAGAADAFLVKYDTDGNKLWTRLLGTLSPDYGLGVATDRVAHIYVTGYTGGGLDGNPSAGSADAFLVKYDTNGKKLWTRQFGTAQDDEAYGVATDGSGGIYVTGYTGGAFAGNQNAGQTDAFLARFPAAP